MQNKKYQILILIILILMVAIVIIRKNSQKRTKNISKELNTTTQLTDTNKLAIDSIVSDTIKSQVVKTDTSDKPIIEKPKPITKKDAPEKSKNPLDIMLSNKKPTVLDLGSSTCIPCKMMKPIFEELEKEYKDRANIILLDIYEHQDLTKKYQVWVIPTQIFFDKDGNQNWRHEGFLAKDKIIEKLKELGVE